MRVSIDGDVRAVLQDIKFDVPGISRQAQVTALNKTSAKIGTQFRRMLAKETGVPQKNFRNQVKQFKATYNRMIAKTWLGMRRGIRLSALAKSPTGKYDKLARGTLYGRSGADAWQATVSTGNKSAKSTRMSGFFVRKGKKRLPIEQVRVSFESVGEAVLLQAVAAVGPDEFTQQYTYDLKRRLARTSKVRRRSVSTRRR